MTGGITSAVQRLTAERDGLRLVVVLRQYEPVPAHGTRGLIEREARILRLAVAAGLSVPELLAACPGGVDSGGHPSILMTRLPGHLDLTPADPGCWLRQIAATAARIHDARVDAPVLETWIDPERLAAPASSSDPALGRAVRRVLGRAVQAGLRGRDRPQRRTYGDAWRRFIPLQVAGRARRHRRDDRPRRGGDARDAAPALVS